MGTIKATNIEPIADNGTVTLGSSGDTFSLGSGVVQSNLNRPAFNLIANASQTFNDSAVTKVVLGTEILDTDNACSDSRFTVPSGKGGLYCIGGQITFSSNCNSLHVGLYVNGNFESNGVNNWIDIGDDQSAGLNIKYLQLSAGDYVELYGLQISGGSRTANGTPLRTGLYGFRIGS